MGRQKILIKVRSPIWLAFIVVSIGAIALTYWPEGESSKTISYSIPPANTNVLAIGDHANNSVIEIDILPPIELDYKTRAEVLELRKEAVLAHNELILGEYVPFGTIFRIDDGFPWWGIEGMFYHGSGDKSIAGHSEESRYILNPYLLVSAEFYGLSIYRHQGMWNSDSISEADLARKDFPYYCLPENLHWQPNKSYGEVTYNLSDYIDSLNKWTSFEIGLPIKWDINAYNARDMGLNFITVSRSDSINLAEDSLPHKPVYLPFWLHRGNSCGYPGGCNNGSPYVKELSDLVIEALPAQAVLNLWYEKPADITQLPDMVFVLNFK